MRQIILDTETTGLSWEKGNRLVEIGCIELVNRRPTGRTYQQYLNPEREMEPGAAEVTGLSYDFLCDKPRFHEIAEDFLEFIRDSELVIHNADFDVGFINAELARLQPHFGGVHDYAQVLDTLKLAREIYPGQRNSLDALCKRLGVDNKHRQLHGALMDAELLTEVYLGLTSGQTGFGFESVETAIANEQPEEILRAVVEGAGVILEASPEESSRHAERMAKISGKSGAVLWND